MTLSVTMVFLAGLGTFLTPCVLPLIPIYLGSLAGSTLDEASGTGSGRGRVIQGALFFIAGSTLVFVLMGLAATLVGRSLHAHRMLLMQIGGLLVFLFGLKLMGVLKIEWLEKELRFQGSSAGTNRKNLLFGIFFALGWTPCTGPVLGAVLTYTASTASDPWTGVLYLSAYAAGFALPLILVATALGTALKVLDRIKKHMRKVEMIGGAALLMVGTLLITGKVSWLTGKAVAAPAAFVPRCEEAGGKATVLTFKSSGCSVCAKMEPVMEKLSRMCAGSSVDFRKIDLNLPRNAAMGKAHRIMRVPTFVFLDGKGKEVARLVGRQTLSMLHQHMTLLTGESCSDVGLVPPPDPRAGPQAAKQSEDCSASSKDKAQSSQSCDKEHDKEQ